jgi:hypothetical protein
LKSLRKLRDPEIEDVDGVVAMSDVFTYLGQSSQFVSTIVGSNPYDWSEDERAIAEALLVEFRAIVEILQGFFTGAIFTGWFRDSYKGEE